MKKILIPTFLILLSCVNTEEGQSTICPAHKEIDRLEVGFAFTGLNPVMPKLELDNLEVDYCYNGNIKAFCIYDIQTSIGKITYSIASFAMKDDLSVTLIDGTTPRLSRNGETITSRISRPDELCANGLIYTLKIQE